MAPAGLRLWLAKGTSSGFDSRMINDSIPAGICSSGQTAIPYYTTWPIPSSIAAGGDYKILITGQLADSVVGQFGTGVGDDSDAQFSIVAASTTLPSGDEGGGDGARISSNSNTASILESIKGSLDEIERSIGRFQGR